MRTVARGILFKQNQISHGYKAYVTRVKFSISIGTSNRGVYANHVSLALHFQTRKLLRCIVAERF